MAELTFSELIIIRDSMEAIYLELRPECKKEYEQILEKLDDYIYSRQRIVTS